VQAHEGKQGVDEHRAAQEEERLAKECAKDAQVDGIPGISKGAPKEDGSNVV